MQGKLLNIRTIAPIFIPIELKTGVDRSSPAFTEFKRRIHEQFKVEFKPIADENKTDYESIDSDSLDYKLFTWCNQLLKPELQIHVFPNNIGIALFDLTIEYTDDVKLLERRAQDATIEAINDTYPAFLEAIRQVCDKKYGEFLCLENSPELEPNILWVSRAILLHQDDILTESAKQLITDWLAHTYRPDDAGDIITGVKNFSLTWLNYIVIDADGDNDERIDAMVLAQYYYAAQENCNKMLKQAIDAAYNENKKNEAQAKLSRSRVTSRLHQVDFHDHLNYLTPSKRTILEEILDGWNYDQLTANGQRMIEICTSKIDETENIKRERSSLLTDLLLVALSFFTVFELSLYLTELSREMMSRPTLDFNDDSRSFMLQYIAEIDTDVMFGSGFFLTLLLVFIYKIIKSR
jgi:hypothetical protein